MYNPDNTIVIINYSIGKSADMVQLIISSKANSRLYLAGFWHLFKKGLANEQRCKQINHNQAEEL